MSDTLHLELELLYNAAHAACRLLHAHLHFFHVRRCLARNPRSNLDGLDRSLNQL